MTASSLLIKEVLREKFKATDELVFIPATKEEFWSFIELSEFRIEYFDNQIVGTESYISLNHSTILTNFYRLFHTHFDRDLYNCYGHNRPVFIKSYDAVLLPDFHIVEGNVELYHYNNLNATTNPSVIVEVFSDSTKNFDLKEKLPCYKTIPSLQHIIFVEQHKPFISVFTRTKKPNEWLNIDYTDLNQRVRIFGKNILLQQLYDEVNFQTR